MRIILTDLLLLSVTQIRTRITDDGRGPTTLQRQKLRINKPLIFFLIVTLETRKKLYTARGFGEYE